LVVATAAVGSLLLVDVTAVDAAALTPTASRQAAPAAPAKPRVTEAADLVSARVAARAQGVRVEALSERTEVHTTWVNPDGTLTTGVSSAPVRFRDSANAWRPVDLNLRKAGGDVVPGGMGLGLRLSGGGTAGSDFVSVDHGGGRSVAWALGGGLRGAKLPAPTLKERVATYPEVAAGVDVRVSVRPRGFEQDFIVKDRAAADAVAAAGGSWEIPVRTKGLTARATAEGGVEFVDGKGKRVSVIPAAQAWDAQVDPRSGEPTSPSKVRVTVSQANPGTAVLSVTPDPGWLADPARVFPVTVDPTYAAVQVFASFDTWVATNYSTDQSTSTELKAGTYDGGTTKARSFLTFPIAGKFAGVDVAAASLSLYETHSFSCTAKPLEVWWAAGASTATRWGSQPWISPTGPAGSLSVAKGFSASCPADRIVVPVTDLMREWASSGSSAGGLMLKAASETDSNGWKRFSSSEGSYPPYLWVTYNRPPNAAESPTFSAGGATYGGEWYTNLARPQLKSKATDPDGSSVQMKIEVHATSSPGSASPLAVCYTGFVASGTYGSCEVDADLPDNTTVYARTSVHDDRDLWNGTWSPMQPIKTGIAPPPAAAVSCPAGYGDGAWVDTPAGASVQCTITATGGTANTSAVSLFYTVDGSTEQSVSVPSTGASVAVTVATDAAHAGLHTITHRTVSRAGKTTSGSHSFGTGGVGMSYPPQNQSTTATGPIKITVAGPPKGSAGAVTATLKWRLAGGGGSATATDWAVSPASLTVTAPDSSSPVTVTGSWNSTSVATGSLRVPTKLDVQVCLTYGSSPGVEKCTWATAPASVLRVPHAFGNGYPTTDAGVSGVGGQVALFTGEFNTSVTDVTVPGYTGTLSLSRSHATYGNLPTAYVPPAAGVFGPGWTASLEGSDVGLAQLIPYDGTRDDGTLAFLDEDGTTLVFQPSAAVTAARRTGADLTAGRWYATDEDTELTGTTLDVTGTGTATVLTLTEPDGTKTTFTATTAPTSSAPGKFTAEKVIEVGGATTTKTIDPATGRVTKVLAPLPAGRAGADCDGTVGGADPNLPGCRALKISYATTTGGTQVAGQVSRVDLEIWAPAAMTVTACDGTTSTAGAAGGAMVTVPVACYEYNTTTKQLRKVTDPRNGLATTYGYGASNELTTITPPGLKKFTLNYATVSSQLKLTSVTRTKVDNTGEATLARFVYAATPTTGTSGNSVAGAAVPDLSQATTDTWGQTGSTGGAPTYAAGVFGPDYTGPVPDPATGAGTGIDWRYADLQYTDAQGYTTNTASFGAGRWLYTWNDYDERGNVVFSLDTDATASILDKVANNEPVGFLPGYGTTTVYNAADTGATPPAGLPKNTPAGAVVTDVYEPVREIARPDGQLALSRPRTHTVYDQGAPNGGLNPATGATDAERKGYGLATMTTVYAADSTENTPPATTTAPIISRTLTGYNPKTGDPGSEPASGWVLGTATSTVIDMDLDGVVDPVGANGTGGDIPTVTYYDALGRTVETRQPKSAAGTGADAGTTLTAYYTVAAQAAPNAACGGTTQAAAWAGLPCRNYKAGAPAGGSSQPMPDSATTGYSYLLAPTTQVETSGTGTGAVTRTTTTAYELDGRSNSVAQTVTGLASSTPTDPSYSTYDPATGILLNTETRNAASVVTGRTSSTYDTWGRTLTSTNEVPGNPANPAAGLAADTATTAYDAAGRVASVTDAKGVTTYTYDGTDAAGKLERRGNVTRLEVTRAGTSTTAANLLTYTGAYDTGGNLVLETLPGGLTRKITFDEAGQQRSLEYLGQLTEYTETVDPVTQETTWTPGTPYTGTWLAWSNQVNGRGQVTREYTPAGAAFDGSTGVMNPGDIQPAPIGQAEATDKTYQYDQAGRLTNVADRTATASGSTIYPDTPASAATPCTMRGYTFDANGNRIAATLTEHADGNCTGTPSATASYGYGYDTADRPVQSVDPDGAGPQTPTGTYLYDPLGRQLTLPGADAPDPAKGDITLGYHDNDLPRTITQGSGPNAATTTYTLDAADRRWRSVTVTANGDTTTTDRHYTDGGDNPAWTSSTLVPAGGSAQPEVFIRYTETLSGDYGVQTDAQGAATMTLANPHGDTATTVTIPAGTTATTPAVSIGGWADYTEYGLPNTGADGTSGVTTADIDQVDGALGYGWLGAKQRSTSAESAGLTLMGVRLYNARRGLFTSVDPVPGGNTTAYTYPQDPVNGFDLDGRINWGNAWKSFKAKAASVGRMITDSKLGKAINVGCNFTWGFISAGCGLAYGLAYAAQGRYGEAVANAVGGFVGGFVAKRILRGYKRVDFSTFHGQRIQRFAKRVVTGSAYLHGGALSTGIGKQSESLASRFRYRHHKNGRRSWYT
jgi:YD repeat-containing protein